MFRNMLRSRQQLPEEECIELLKNEVRGVLSVLGDEDYPYGMPINHYYCEEDGKIYFHSGQKGHRTDSMRRHDKASFCVYDSGVQKEGHWSLNIRSVIVFGRIEFIEDQETIYSICRKLCHKFTDDEAYIEDEIRSSGPRTLMYAMTIENLCGKRVSER